MEWPTWVIIILLVFSFVQYAYPDKVKFATDPTWGKVKSFIDTKNPVSSKPAVICPDIHEPVCADGTTFENSCEAALAGKLEVVAGAC